jgi:hypothetical protein
VLTPGAAYRCVPQVYGISTEDMDSLTFGTPRLIRHLMAPVSQKQNAMEFDHALVCMLGSLTLLPMQGRLGLAAAACWAGQGGSSHCLVLRLACQAPCCAAALLLLLLPLEPLPPLQPVPLRLLPGSRCSRSWS